MSIDKEKKQSKRGFWSSLFRSAKKSKIEKDHRQVDDNNGRPAPAKYPSRAHGLVRPQVSSAPVSARPAQEAAVNVREKRAMAADEMSVDFEDESKPYPYNPDAANNGHSQRPYVPPSGRLEVPLGPLTEWPPRGVPGGVELSLDSASRLIARGAAVHVGHERPVPHAPADYYMLFTTSSEENPGPSRLGGGSNGSNSSHSGRNSRRGDADSGFGSGSGTDAADMHDGMTQLMTMRLIHHHGSNGSSAPIHPPWDSLEQPSFASCFGRRPGTITLNHWASQSSELPPAIALRDAGVRPRDIDLAHIFQRLRDLQLDGLEEDDDDRLYRNLYRRLLRDPDRVFSPHRTLDLQITDLIMVLSRPDYWIDFTQPRNQIATRFFFDPTPANHAQYTRFFHQLLLSLELELRISSRRHSAWAKEKLVQQLPPTLQMNLALARRWRDNVRIDAYGPTPAHIQLRLKLKNRQIRMLRRFARVMKWPNLAATLASLKQCDASGRLEAVSAHALAFFSGLVLPGPTFPFTLMNSLIDIDPDRSTAHLALLTHLHPHCGFQYRSSYTYWTSTCIVGKVLAPTCSELAGWVGPARPTVDLGRSQIARIRSRRPRQHVTPQDIETMHERSHPLGPMADTFPVSEYKLIATDPNDIVDTVRIELLSLRPAQPPSPGSGGTASFSHRHELAAAAGGDDPDVPHWFDASVQFAIDGVSWPLNLNYDVSFVCAWPCSNGPHPLFFDYNFAVVPADGVVGINDWATPCAQISAAHHHNANAYYTPVSKDGDDEKVLVIEAFGVPDTEVLARAWCAHWGLSAIVADIRKTCMSCAIREAFAATLTVVILVDGRATYNDD